MFNRRLIIIIGIIFLFFNSSTVYSMGNAPKKSSTSEPKPQLPPLSRGMYFCDGKTANIGQTMDEVEDSLGSPLGIQKYDLKNQNKYMINNKSEITITKWFYKCGLKTYIFFFQNDNLISIRRTMESPPD